MLKFVLGLTVALGSILSQGCANMVARDGHERVVRRMREENAALQMQASEAERLQILNARLQHENELLKAHNSAYAELSDELRGMLDGLKIEGVERMPNGAWSIEAHLLFAPGKADISDSGRQVLRRFLDVWRGRDVRFRIVGHTDTDPIVKTANIYTTRTNLELGMHRALKVMDVLLNEGIEEGKLVIESRGNSEPVMVDDGSPASKKKNRRVEIYVLKQ